MRSRPNGRRVLVVAAALCLTMLLQPQAGHASFFGDIGDAFESGLGKMGNAIKGTVENVGRWTVNTGKNIARLVQGDPKAFIDQINNTWYLVRDTAITTIESGGLPNQLITPVLREILPKGEVTDFLFDTRAQMRQFVVDSAVDAADTFEKDVAEISGDLWDVASQLDDPEAFGNALAHKFQKWSPVASLSYIFTEDDPAKGVARAARAIARQADIVTTYVTPYSKGGVKAIGKKMAKGALKDVRSKVLHGLLDETLDQGRSLLVDTQVNPQRKAAMQALMAAVATEVRNNAVMARPDLYVSEVEFPADPQNLYFFTSTGSLVRVAPNGQTVIVGRSSQSWDPRFAWMIQDIHGLWFGVDAYGRVLGGAYGTEFIGQVEQLSVAPVNYGAYLFQVVFTPLPNHYYYVTSASELVRVLPNGQVVNAGRLTRYTGDRGFIWTLQDEAGDQVHINTQGSVVGYPDGPRGRPLQVGYASFVYTTQLFLAADQQNAFYATSDWRIVKLSPQGQTWTVGFHTAIQDAQFPTQIQWLNNTASFVDTQNQIWNMVGSTQYLNHALYKLQLFLGHDQQNRYFATANYQIHRVSAQGQFWVVGTLTQLQNNPFPYVVQWQDGSFSYIDSSNRIWAMIGNTKFL